jgi:ligand-binding sensor domain-containing protein
LDGTYRWDGSSWRYYRVDKNIQWLRFHKIRKDRHGRLWFLRLSKEFLIETDTVGVYIYENKKFRPFGKSEGLLSDRVYAFAEGDDGALWFGTSKGVSCLKEGAWTHWTVDTGLKMKYILLLQSITKIKCGVPIDPAESLT